MTAVATHCPYCALQCAQRLTVTPAAAAQARDAVGQVSSTTMAVEVAGRPDLVALSQAADAAQVAVTEAEAIAVRAEAAHSAARQSLDVSREPLAEAERRVQRLDTEAKIFWLRSGSSSIATP